MTLDLDDPIAVLLAVDDAFGAAGIERALYGGLALAVYGEPRATRDADLAVVGTSPAVAATALTGGHLVAVETFAAMRFGGLSITRFTLLGGAGGSLNTVDLVTPCSDRFARAALDRAVTCNAKRRSSPGDPGPRRQAGALQRSTNVVRIRRPARAPARSGVGIGRSVTMRNHKVLLKCRSTAGFT